MKHRSSQPIWPVQVRSPRLLGQRWRSPGSRTKASAHARVSRRTRLQHQKRKARAWKSWEAGPPQSKRYRHKLGAKSVPLWYSDAMVPIALHGRLRRSPLTSWIFDVKDRVDHWRGGTNKSPTASLSPLGKRLAIVQLLLTHNLHIVVESGTFLGDTCRFLSRRGYAVTTIELDPQLAAFARLRFAGNKNVRVVEGDSGELLAEIATALDKPALYYLDGHYSGPGTAKAVLETPIMHEIKAVLAHAAPKSSSLSMMHGVLATTKIFQRWRN